MAAEATPTRPRVLLADDEASIRATLAPFLDRAGFDVTVVADGQAALDALQPEGGGGAEPFDAAVLDVLMSGLDGREVLRQVRRAGRWTPIVLLTRVGGSAERAMAIEEGADDYLNKPFDPHELVARLRAVLRRVQAGAGDLGHAPHVVSGRLRLDRVAHRAFLDGRELALTPRAFALLDHLAVHPDELLTRERLLEAVWGWENPVGSRAVDHRIAELRRLLADDAGQPEWIETVPGRGYRFVGPVAVAGERRGG